MSFKFARRLTLSLVFVLFILLTVPSLLFLPAVLLFGWAPAAKRLISASSFSWLQISVFLSACLLLLFGMHWFLRQFKGWSFRWTFALGGTLAFVLLAIMSVLGIAHQTGWILLSKEPVFVSSRHRMRDRFDLLNTANVLGKIGPTNGARVDASELLCDDRLPDTHDRKRPWEKYNLLLLDPTNDYFAVIWPRDRGGDSFDSSAFIRRDGRVFPAHNTNQLFALIRKAEAHGANQY